MNAKEILAALPDALALRGGIDLTDPHPLADSVAQMSLAQLAEEIGEHMLAADPRYTHVIGHSTRAAIAAGLTSEDFGVAVAVGLQRMLVRRYESLADHLPLCAPVPVNDYKEITLPMLDLGPGLEPVGGNGELPNSAMIDAAAGQTGKLLSYSRLLRITRQTFINDQWNAVSTALTGFSASASRLENRLIFDMLESNPQLSDGDPLFHADVQTEVAGALSDETLGQAMGLLRMQQTKTGETSGFGAKFLVVDPYQEAKALKLVQDMGANLWVIASPNIGPGRWYVMADPESAPVIGRLTMSRGRAPIRAERKKPPLQFDGVGVLVGTDVGFVIVDRIGVVRGHVE